MRYFTVLAVLFLVQAMIKVNVVQYNLLCSALGIESNYPLNNAEAVRPQNRLIVVLRILEEEIARDSILCLQEVSLEWAGKLVSFFDAHNYCFTYRLYGNYFNGYMGIGIAFPRKVYSILECELLRISDTKLWPESRLGAPQPTSVVTHLWNYALKLFSNPPALPDIDPWSRSRDKHNAMVWLRLEHRESKKVIAVATYHMPCDFKLPQVMYIHTLLSFNALVERQKGEPVIFAGDFNFQPDSGTYKMVTSGHDQPEDPAWPKPPAHDSWVPHIAAPFDSAYRQVQGKEPEWTNWAQSERDTTPFQGCLDYIFLRGCQAVEVKNLRLPEKKEMLPSRDDPSDHLLIAATISLQ